jgi:hypothetical protein
LTHPALLRYLSDQPPDHDFGTEPSLIADRFLLSLIFLSGFWTGSPNLDHLGIHCISVGSSAQG